MPKFRADLTGITKNLQSGRYQITFELTEGEIEQIGRESKDLSVEVKKWRNKRSKDANGLLWACIGEIAKAIDRDKWDVYLMLLKQFGQYTYICVSPKAVEQVKQQWRETEVIGTIDINGREAVQLLCYYGSSTYDTKEFSYLLQGTINEMKEIGLDTPTSEEVERSLEKWTQLFTKDQNVISAEQ